MRSRGRSANSNVDDVNVNATFGVADVVRFHLFFITYSLKDAGYPDFTLPQTADLLYCYYKAMTSKERREKGKKQRQYCSRSELGSVVLVMTGKLFLDLVHNAFLLWLLVAGLTALWIGPRCRCWAIAA